MRRRIRLILTRLSFREPPGKAGMEAGLFSPFGAGAGLLVSFASALPLKAGLGVLAGGGDGSCLAGAFDSPESFSACGGAVSDGAAAEDAPASPGAKRNRSCPTVTVSSSLASSSVILPEVGALTVTSICERVKKQICQLARPSPKWVGGRGDKKGRGGEKSVKRT